MNNIKAPQLRTWHWLPELLIQNFPSSLTHNLRARYAQGRMLVLHRLTKEDDR